MAQIPELAKLQGELVDAFEWGEEHRARALLSRLAVRPRQATKGVAAAAQAHQATSFPELRRAGDAYAKVLGTDAARALILAVGC